MQTISTKFLYDEAGNVIGAEQTLLATKAEVKEIWDIEL